jgi:hypothetical protein
MSRRPFWPELFRKVLPRPLLSETWDLHAGWRAQKLPLRHFLFGKQLRTERPVGHVHSNGQFFRKHFNSSSLLLSLEKIPQKKLERRLVDGTKTDQIKTQLSVWFLSNANP